MYKTKVCHLTSVHSPYDIRIFQKECRALATGGYDVTLIAPCENDQTVDGIKIRAIPKSRTRFSRFTRTVQDVYRQAVQVQADIYHIHDFELIPVALLLKIKGKKIIYDAHEDFPRQNLSREWIPPLLRWPLAFVTEIFENITTRAFDVIIGATPFISTRFRTLGAKVININNYPLLPRQPVPMLNPNTNAQNVCYVGAIALQRGIREMVEAIGQTSCRLLLVGAFDEGPVLDELKSKPGWSNVIQTGHVPHSEVRKFLADCLAGLVVFHPEPNHINSQPTKIYEYMAAGLPVIASNFAYWREVIESRECGLCIDPLKPAELAIAIQWLADNPAEAKRMGENGQLAVEREFNWNAEERKLLALYGELSAGTHTAEANNVNAGV